MTTNVDLQEIRALTAVQAGIVSRDQLRQLGVARAVFRREIRARRWRRVLPRTYATFTGPLPSAARAWAAVLYAGPDATLSHWSAAFHQRLVDEEPNRLEVTVRHGHRVPSRPAVLVHQSRHIDERRHPSRLPPQTRIEDTVLDLTEVAATEVVVVDLLLRACQRRLTTAGRLAARSRARSRLRWRRLVNDVLGEVRVGVLSALERRYLRDVERAHGLPRGRRNRPEGHRGARVYRDVRYWPWRVVVELDGTEAHPDEQRDRDDFRDNEIRTREDVTTLRYGWRSVTARACGVAGQVGAALQADGWTGSPVACGPGCLAVRAA
jgi:hypothetical protein